MSAHRGYDRSRFSQTAAADSIKPQRLGVRVHSKLRRVVKRSEYARVGWEMRLGTLGEGGSWICSVVLFDTKGKMEVRYTCTWPNVDVLDVRL